MSIFDNLNKISVNIFFTITQIYKYEQPIYLKISQDLKSKEIAQYLLNNNGQLLLALLTV